MKFIFTPLLLIFLFPGCGDDVKKEDPRKLCDSCICQFEFNPGSHDTINRKDCIGRRQGKWVKNKYGNDADTIWKYGDTLYFRNDILQRNH